MHGGYYYLVMLGSWGRPWEVVQGSQSDKAPPVVSHANSSRERLRKAGSSLLLLYRASIIKAFSGSNQLWESWNSTSVF